jgi:succinate dehydrogenase / fumarate reductase cytochrome b subunit
MTWKQFFSTSVGKKFTVGATGLFLVLFLIVHAGVNACIFLNDGGETFNKVAYFMSHNWILRFLEVGLFVFLILHIVQALIVWRQNKKARPVGYHVSKANRNSTWYSRSMGLLGTLILLFLIMHINHFFVGTKQALYGGGDGDHDLYAEMQEVFSNGWIVVLYMIGLAALFWHLVHGFQSAFQTMGINHKKYSPIINKAGWIYSVIIIILFALMPLSVYLGWIY